MDVSLEDLKKLPYLLRDNDFSLTAVMSDKRVIALEAGDTTTAKLVFRSNIN